MAWILVWNEITVPHWEVETIKILLHVWTLSVGDINPISCSIWFAAMENVLLYTFIMLEGMIHISSIGEVIIPSNLTRRQECPIYVPAPSISFVTSLNSLRLPSLLFYLFFKMEVVNPTSLLLFWFPTSMPVEVLDWVYFPSEYMYWVYMYTQSSC